MLQGCTRTALLWEGVSRRSKHVETCVKHLSQMALTSVDGIDKRVPGVHLDVIRVQSWHHNQKIACDSFEEVI